MYSDVPLKNLGAESYFPVPLYFLEGEKTTTNYCH